MAINKARVYTVTSIKGGTGKTTTTLNLAGIFSTQKKKTLIIDLDLYSGGIAASLNIDSTNDLYLLVNDLVNNKFNSIEKYVCKYNDEIDIIPAPKDPRLAGKINCKYLSIVLKKVSMIYDVVLIDTNHIMNDINLLALDFSDEILYVMTNDLVDLKNMKSMVSIYKDMEKKNYKIILNNSIGKSRDYFSGLDIKNIIKDNIDYIIPNSFYNKKIDKYVIEGKILTLDKKIRVKNKKSIRIFTQIVNSISKVKEEK